MISLKDLYKPLLVFLEYRRRPKKVPSTEEEYKVGSHPLLSGVRFFLFSRNEKDTSYVFVEKPPIIFQSPKRFDIISFIYPHPRGDRKELVIINQDPVFKDGTKKVVKFMTSSIVKMITNTGDRSIDSMTLISEVSNMTMEFEIVAASLSGTYLLRYLNIFEFINPFVLYPLYPKLTIYTDEERVGLLRYIWEQTKIKKDGFPILSFYDPQARYYGLIPGMIIKEESKIRKRILPRIVREVAMHKKR